MGAGANIPVLLSHVEQIIAAASFVPAADDHISDAKFSISAKLRSHILEQIFHLMNDDASRRALWTGRGGGAGHQSNKLIS